LPASLSRPAITCEADARTAQPARRASRSGCRALHQDQRRVVRRPWAGPAARRPDGIDAPTVGRKVGGGVARGGAPGRSGEASRYVTVRFRQSRHLITDQLIPGRMTWPRGLRAVANPAPGGNRTWFLGSPRGAASEEAGNRYRATNSNRLAVVDRQPSGPPRC